MVLHDKSIERNKTIIALMWMYVLPSWILFDQLFSEAHNGIVVLLIPIIPYLTLLLFFFKTNTKKKKDWMLVILAGIAVSLPELFLFVVFICWSNNGFAP